MTRMKAATIGQPHEIAIGPPLLKPWPKVVKHPARIEMIENEIGEVREAGPGAVELLLVAELGQPALVVGETSCLSHALHSHLRYEVGPMLAPRMRDRTDLGTTSSVLGQAHFRRVSQR